MKCVVWSDQIGMSAERNVNINCMQKIGLNAANIKSVESADVGIAIGTGSNTVFQTIEGVKKLIKSLLDNMEVGDVHVENNFPAFIPHRD